MRDDPPLIAVVDDDVPVGTACARLLAATGYRARVFASAWEFLAEMPASSPACALIDVRMPELDGPALLKELRDADEYVPAIFMTAIGDVTTIVDAMKAGAIDLLSKPFTADALLAAVANAMDVARLTQRERRSLADLWRRLARVTPREAEVCALVSRGLANKVVAARIGTTEKTVKVHRARGLLKLGARSLPDLVRMADALVGHREWRQLRIDGVIVPRPRAAEILLDVLAAQSPRPPIAIDPAWSDGPSREQAAAG
jgi:FixJ family two-component response regulator